MITVLRKLMPLSIAIVLVACGAGVGGTGTGNVYPPPSFGATPSNVCKSSLAAQLDCGAASAPNPAGTGVLFMTDASARMTARLEGDRMEIEAPCARLNFIGDWGDRASDSRYWGTLTRTLPASVAPGTALATPGTGGGLNVTLLDAGGALLLGPIELRRVSNAPPVTCP